MPKRALRGTRYLTAANTALVHEIHEELPYLDFDRAKGWYEANIPRIDSMGRALLGCNDRYFLLRYLLRRRDIDHPWLFDRCREVEAAPDGHIDLWARFHYKSTIITFAGAIQEIVCNPEICIAIFSVVKPIAQEFLAQIKEEFENNDYLKALYSDVLYANPKSKTAGDGRPAKWSLARGITVKRRGNPKEATIEAHGLIDGQPTSRHFPLHIYDDVVTQDYLSEDQIAKTTKRWEMADNLGTHEGTRKWMPGTRYHYADTNGVIIERKSLAPRIYPATDDGTLNGKPVFLSPARWAEIKRDQRSTVSAQMLLNPVAGNEATFKTTWFKTYDVIPSVMNVYIMCDPSKGRTERSDRTAIAVIGIDTSGNKYLLDGYCHRMRLSDRWTYLKQLEQKWSQHDGVQLVKIGYEQYGMQVDLEVLEEYRERERKEFRIEEINTPRQGGHSKNDRIERLEPDLRESRFYLPCAVYHPDYGGRAPYDGMAYWTVWSETDQKAHELKMKIEGTPEKLCPYNIGQLIFRPMQGYTRLQKYWIDKAQKKRVVTPLRRRDESGDIYDLTRHFVSEASRHPFATHDDFLDACSRIFELDPQKPQILEVGATEPLPEDALPEMAYDA